MSGMTVGQRVTLNFKGRSITATVVKIEPSEQVEQSELPPVLTRDRSDKKPPPSSPNGGGPREPHERSQPARSVS